MPLMKRLAHMPLANSAGFDLYVDSEDGDESRFYLPFIPPIDAESGFESIRKFKTKKTRYVTINFPSYSQVKNLYIGLENGATLGTGKKYTYNTPVVFYGSSITQGACASRPGNIYQNMLSRKIDMNFLSGEGNKKSDIILKNIINLSNALDMTTLTEGVETEKQYKMLLKMGCTLFQGYYFARPMPLDDFQRYLEEAKRPSQN